MTASVDANDATSGIYYVEFVLNGEVLWRDYVAPYEAELPREFPLSFNKLKIIAYDMAGHYIESEEISYIKIL